MPEKHLFGHGCIASHVASDLPTPPPPPWGGGGGLWPSQNNLNHPLKIIPMILEATHGIKMIVNAWKVWKVDDGMELEMWAAHMHMQIWFNSLKL